MTQTPPKRIGHPIFGNLLQAKNEVQEFYTHLMSQHGDIAEFCYFRKKFYLINQPEYIGRVLTESTFVLAKLQHEVDTTLEGGTVTLADFKHLSYNRMVIDETLRLYPPAWYTERVATEPVMLGDYRITPNTTLVICPYATQRDARYFESPFTFNPERFSPANKARMQRYTYLPFGGGVHLCIGNQFALTMLQIILASMVQEYEITLQDTNNVVTQALITLTPQDDLIVNLCHRQTESNNNYADVDIT